MFWALTCETGKRYSQIPEEAFCITMAALEPKEKLPDNKQVSLMLEHGSKEFLLCTLEYDRVMQVNLSLKFGKGEETFFFVSGEGTIHLSGHLLEQHVEEKKYADDIYSQPSTSKGITASDEEEEDDDDDDDDDDDANEVEEIEECGTSRLLGLDASDDEDSQDYNPEDDIQAVKSKQSKTMMSEENGEGEEVLSSEDNEDEDYEEEDSDVLLDEDSDSDDDDENNAVETNSGNSSKKRRKNLLSMNNKRLKHDVPVGKKGLLANVKRSKKSEAAENVSDSDNEDAMGSSIGHTPMKRFNDSSDRIGSQKVSNLSSQQGQSSGSSERGKTSAGLAGKKFSHRLPSGVEYEDVRIGNGPAAKPGKLLHVYYVGKLQSGEVFEERRENRMKPFPFRLGKDQALPGWEEGLVGMRVGGKRKLKVPPKVGYGKKKMPHIPPNSTLYFSVELKAVS